MILTSLIVSKNKQRKIERGIRIFVRKKAQFAEDFRTLWDMTIIRLSCFRSWLKAWPIELSVEIGVGPYRRWLSVHKYVVIPKEEVCRILPFWFVVTGCDTVSMFAGWGNKSIDSVAEVSWCNSMPTNVEIFRTFFLVNWQIKFVHLNFFQLVLYHRIVWWRPCLYWTLCFFAVWWYQFVFKCQWMLLILLYKERTFSSKYFSDERCFAAAY